MIKFIVIFSTIFSGFVMAEQKSDEAGNIEKMINSRVLEKLKMIDKNNIINFSKNLLKKEAELKNLEKRLKRKEEELGIHAKELDDKIGRFIASQQKFIGCVDDLDKGKKRRVSHLVEIIGGMRPAVAGKVLSVQDLDIAVAILSELPAQKMSKIFNSMDQEISARLQKQYMDMKQ